MLYPRQRTLFGGHIDCVGLLGQGPSGDASLLGNVCGNSEMSVWRASVGRGVSGTVSCLCEISALSLKTETRLGGHELL